MDSSAHLPTLPRTGEHLCKPWMGRLLASPLRALLDPPRRLLAPFVEPGMTVLDVGTGMGFHAITVARLVGPSGRVLALDVQEAMLRGLERRARRRRLLDRIDARRCTQTDLGLDDLEGQADLALLIHTVHEMTDPVTTVRQVRAALRSGGRLLVAEPDGHIAAEDRDRIFDLIADLGFVEIRPLEVAKGRGGLYEKP